MPYGKKEIPYRKQNISGDIIVSITVRADKQLRFIFSFIQNIGAEQRLHFNLKTLNHIVTESSFLTPYTKLTGAEIDTDFNNFNPQDIPNLHPFNITLENNRPRYFFYKQGSDSVNSHCRKGMIFVVNIN